MDWRQCRQAGENVEVRVHASVHKGVRGAKEQVPVLGNACASAGIMTNKVQEGADNTR